MMKFLLSLFLMISLAGLNLSAQTDKPTGNLTFHITGFEKNQGQALILFYSKDDKVPKKPGRHLKAEIVNKEAVLTLENIPYGEYAAIIVHDINGNGVVDHKFGMPSEPLGYTNNWKLSLFSGMPSFDKLKFSHSKPVTIVTIRMHE